MASFLEEACVCWCGYEGERLGVQQAWYVCSAPIPLPNSMCEMLTTVLGVGEMMDKDLESFRDTIEPKWKHLGGRRELGTVEKVEELLTNERFKAAGGR